jgi:hypothetical protein
VQREEQELLTLKGLVGRRPEKTINLQQFVKGPIGSLSIGQNDISENDCVVVVTACMVFPIRLY